ncbi:tetratricopeptide repeat protein [Kribbella sindirgiensis]|nr:tetratricopeptide repeat protein [Kribbella sindirgiensis]
MILTAPEAPAREFRSALRLLRADAPAEIIMTPLSWPRWSVLLPHVLAVTGLPEVDDVPLPRSGAEEMSWLLDRAATYLAEHGRAEEAKPLLERALLIDEATYGSDHPTVGVGLSNLARVLKILGDADGARVLLERALAIHEATYGSDHPAVAIDLGNLAEVVWELGDVTGARRLLERALAIHEATYGSDHRQSLALRQLLAEWVDQ